MFWSGEKKVFAVSYDGILEEAGYAVRCGFCSKSKDVITIPICFLARRKISTSSSSRK